MSTTDNHPLLHRLRDSGFCDNVAARRYMGEAADEIERLSGRTRRTLPNRRAHELIDMEFRGRTYVVGVGRSDDGSLAEVFVDAKKQSTDAADDARDAALVLSLALQFGCPPETIRRAATRDASGAPAGIVGAVLDVLEGGAE